jgi:hypothetical protein
LAGPTGVGVAVDGTIGVRVEVEVKAPVNVGVKVSTGVEVAPAGFVAVAAGVFPPPELLFGVDGALLDWQPKLPITRHPNVKKAKILFIKPSIG